MKFPHIIKLFKNVLTPENFIGKFIQRVADDGKNFCDKFANKVRWTLGCMYQMAIMCLLLKS